MIRYKTNIRMRTNSRFDAALREMPRVFAAEGRVVFQRRNTVKAMRLRGIDADGTGEIIVKQYHRPNAVQRLWYTFFEKSHAERSFRNAIRLRRMGTDTPECLGYAEERLFGLYQRGYTVYTVCRDAELTAWLNITDDRQRLIREYACFVASLHEKGIIHRDLHPSNVLCRQDEHTHSWRFALIDVGGVKFLPKGKVPRFGEWAADLLPFSNQERRFTAFVACYLESRNMYSAELMERVMNEKRRRNCRRHPVKHFFKRFSKAYYAMLDRAYRGMLSHSFER